MNKYRFQTVRISRNDKTGPIPTVASTSNTCPDTCPLNKPLPGSGKKRGGCYGKHGPIAWQWAKLDAGTTGTDFDGLLEFIDSLPRKRLWRYNTVGDLIPSQYNPAKIDSTHFEAIANTNAGRNLRGFGFTHYDLTLRHNRKLIKDAYLSGLVINASTNTMCEAIALKASHPELSVVTIAPAEYLQKVKTIDNVRFVQCPATYQDVQCIDCGLCAKPNRAEVIVFPSHGAGSKTADIIATTNQ